MKKIFSILCAMSLALGGCSIYEEEGPQPVETDYGYIAVNIVQPSSVGGRAEVSSGFEDGDENENFAKQGLFYIFDADGNKYGDPKSIDLSGDKEATPGNSVEYIYDGILVIDGVASGPIDNAKQLVCVLNAPAGLGAVNNISDLQEKIDAYGGSTKGAFIMSNSVYKNGTSTVLGADINGHIAQSPEAAKGQPVDIYVERVVAKVRAKAATGGFTNTEGAKPKVDGIDKNLTIKVTGIEVANIAKSSYLFKNVEGINYTWAWNDATNKRSYWETVPEVGTGDGKLEFDNKTYNEIATDANFDITTVSHKEYVQPNTSDQKTAILVTAQLMDGAAPADLAYIRGSYTTKAGAMNVIANYMKSTTYRKKVSISATETKIEHLAPEDFVWKNNSDLGATVLEHRYEVVAQLNPAETFEICDADGNAVADGVKTVNDYLKSDAAKSYRAQVFTDGKCYYYVNIDHTPVTGQTATTYEGVVRNHIYDLTLQSIKGIGTPVFDPSDKIIPETVDKGEMFYLAAKVNVLAWKLVNQNVNFE